MYQDPGALSYLIQLLIAGLLATVFWCKQVRQKIMQFFRRNRDQAPDDEK
jgi:hypothetical protein